MHTRVATASGDRTTFTLLVRESERRKVLASPNIQVLWILLVYTRLFRSV